MSEKSSFKLTYATMYNPPDELHQRYEQSLEALKSNLGQDHGMVIGAEERFSSAKFEDRSPINRNLLLATFPKGDAQDAQDVLKAAKAAYPLWSHTKWQDRIALIRRAADIIDERLFDLAALLSLEVGKNRMEALGDIAETADLFRYACDIMEENNGFINRMNSDPLIGYQSSNTSFLKPYGVWVVISPFNFPAALTGGPLAHALVAGNTVVVKPASDTPWIPRLIVDCLRDAGLPDGVVNFVTGPGGTLGQALMESPLVDGLTFTGSYDVGMGIYRDFAKKLYTRPVILEMGGKNPAIVSRNADLEMAAAGIVRSAFGLQGQKCSACSRVLVEEQAYDALVERLVALTEKLTLGDPTLRSVFMGPVVNQKAYQDFQQFSGELARVGKILAGGRAVMEGELEKGWFVLPTLAAEVPYDHHLWKQEMFLPITTIGKVKNLEEAMNIANDVMYGLTAGFYGSDEEAAWFFDKIEAGVAYVNRPQGATTGAWPGFQPFGGWKASGATGKNAGGPHYLQYYMREQIHTVIRKV